MNGKKAFRTKNRIIAGVGGRLGEYFEVNPWIFRLGFIFLTFFNGLGILLYLILWLIMPREPGWRIKTVS